MRRNPRARTGDEKELLWYGWGLEALGVLKRAGMKISMPLIVRATQLEAEGLETIAVVHRAEGELPSHVIGCAVSIDDYDAAVLLRQRDAHAVGLGMLAAGRQHSLPPVVTRPLRSLMHEYKTSRWADYRPYRAQIEYDALGQFQDPAIAREVLIGFARWRARGSR